MGIAAIISLLDFAVCKTLDKQSVGKKLLLQLFQHTIDIYWPTISQDDLCSLIYSTVQMGEGLTIYGSECSGKTSSIFIFLARNTKKMSFIKGKNWLDNIIYIDCKNQKEDIWNFFNNTHNFDINLYQDSFIVIDNLELMGKSFYNDVRDIMKKSSSIYILIKDLTFLEETVPSEMKTKKIEQIVPDEFDSYAQVYKYNYEHLTHDEKLVLGVIYFISQCQNLISVKEIRETFFSTLSKNGYRKIIRKLARKKFLMYFPFNRLYIFVCCKATIRNIQFREVDFVQDFKDVYNCLCTQTKYSESIWLCLIHLPLSQIKEIPNSQKYKIFSRALDSGNYNSLCSALKQELDYAPQKTSQFLYELGTLHFYESKQAQAFKYYNSFINVSDSELSKKRSILRIIEATHGDINKNTRKNIYIYLELLSKAGKEYALYSRYWKWHIELERGRLKLSEYYSLISDFESYESIVDNEIYNELLKRCYTDVIRIHYILMSTMAESFKKRFRIAIEKFYPNNTLSHQYHDVLYLKAYSLHYIELLKNVMEGNNCEYIYKRACRYYEIALRYGQENIKSNSTCELKYIDLQLFDTNNVSKFDDYKAVIKRFIHNAEINNVSVHVAFAKTLLIKLYILTILYDEERLSKNSTRNNIKELAQCIKEAKDIYRTYRNIYGIIRIDILEKMYDLCCFTDQKQFEISLKRLADIMKKYKEYQREYNMLAYLNQLYEKQETQYATLLSIIRAYPIVLQ